MPLQTLPSFTYRASKPIFIDSFNRADGLLRNGWENSSWTIQNGNAINTPVLGQDFIRNGTFDSWSGNTPTYWNVTGGAVTQSGSDGSEGVGFARITGGNIQQAITPNHKWCQSGINVNFDDSGSIRYRGAWGIITCSAPIQPVVSGFFANFTMRVDLLSGAAVLDDIYCKEIALDNIIAIRRHMRGNAYAQVNIDRADYNSSGVVHYYDSNNMVMAFETGLGTVRLLKIVNGVASNLVLWAINYVADAPLKLTKSGINYTVTYNGLDLATAQIGEAVFSRANHWGMLSAYQGNNVSEYKWVKLIN